MIDDIKKMWSKYKTLHWAVQVKMIFTFIPNLLLHWLVVGLLKLVEGLIGVNSVIYKFTMHEPDFSGLKEVWEGIKGLWKQLKEKPHTVKAKVAICFIPALILFVIVNIGEFMDKVADLADKYGTKMIGWAWRDPRYGKNLAGQKPYCPKEV